jgi:lipoteichoic acid synthase
MAETALLLWQGVIDGLRRHSLFALLVAFFAIYTSKSLWYGHFFNPNVHPGIPDVAFLDFLVRDLIFFGGVMALVVIVENLIPSRLVLLITVPVSVVICLASLVEAFWHAITGLPINLSVIKAGLSRSEDAIPIVVSVLDLWAYLLLGASLVVLVGFPLVFRAHWLRRGLYAPRGSWLALTIPGVLLLLGGAGFALHGDPAIPGWRLHANNFIVSIVSARWDPLQREPHRPFPAASAVSPVKGTALGGEAPSQDEGASESAATQPTRRNVIVVMLEAVSHRASSFGEPDADRTPFLASLAARGLRAERMRAVIPHTSKSIVSFMCGEYPAMQNAILETADNYPLDCLPRWLSARGYATALFQSAWGTFEDRPRLAKKMGFEHFSAWPEFPDAPLLGYLAADDSVLLRPTLEWIRAQRRPFFVFWVTSMTHHPYVIPKAVPGHERLAQLGSKQRYHALVRYQDAVMHRLYRALEQVGLSNSTALVFFGDHGEGFGEHGIYQHDNTFFEEGLRVPLVAYTPWERRPRVVPENRSLLDVPPTVLELLGIRWDEAAMTGRSLYRSRPANEKRYFACWYDNTCVGYVSGAHKLVFLPMTRSWQRYDLIRDPLERAPELESERDRPEVEALGRWLAARRFGIEHAERSNLDLYRGKWKCPADGPCWPAGFDKGPIDKVWQ